MPSICPTCRKHFKGPSIASHAMVCDIDWRDLYWQKVNKSGPGGCWLWTGALEGAGYGHYRVADKDRRAHHLALELVGQTIAKGMSVMHTCDVRNCVNPAHLRVGTHAQNMADMARKRRGGQLGAKCFHAKLTEAQVLEIRAKYQRTMSKGHTLASNVVELAAEYGVRRSTIKNVALGHTWRSVK